MKITLGQLVNSREAISEILELPLPPKTTYRMVKFQKMIEPETSSFDAARIKLLTPHASEDGAIKFNELKPEVVAEINRELSELLAHEVEVEFDPLLDMEKLSNYWEQRDVAVKPSSILAADFLFEDF